MKKKTKTESITYILVAVTIADEESKKKDITKIRKRWKCIGQKVHKGEYKLFLFCVLSLGSVFYCWRFSAILDQNNVSSFFFFIPELFGLSFRWININLNCTSANCFAKMKFIYFLHFFFASAFTNYSTSTRRCNFFSVWREIIYFFILHFFCVPRIVH